MKTTHEIIESLEKKNKILEKKLESSRDSLERAVLEGRIKRNKLDIQKLKNETETRVVPNLDAPVLADSRRVSSNRAGGIVGSTSTKGEYILNI